MATDTRAIYGNAIILPYRGGETWVIKSDAVGELVTTQISFTSNGQKFTSIGAPYTGLYVVLRYGNVEVAGYDPGSSGVYEFDNEAYRKLTFDTPTTGDLLTWLQSNAVKQPDDTSVQDTKALTITSNGTVSVTPDAPYDALKKVDVTVNVASGGGGGFGHKVTFPATAQNWNVVMSTSVLYLADNTTKSITDYSSISGQTIENVIGIGCRSDDAAYVLRMNLSEGGIASAVINTGGYIQPYISTAPGITPAYYMGGDRVFWWPIADTVISAIEMYNTD